MDKIDFMSLIPQEARDKVIEYKRRTFASVQENCNFLGIEYSDALDNYADEIAHAAKFLQKCGDCSCDIQTAAECPLAVGREAMHADFAKFGASLPVCNLYRAAIKQRCVQRLLGESGLGKRFTMRTFSNFRVTPQTQEAYNACYDFCNNFTAECKGLKLYGGYGCGKTHLVAAIINRLAAEKGVAGVFVNVPDFLASIRKSYGKEENSADKIIETAKDASLLVLDDLGAEKTTDWVQEQLYRIINYRYENLAPTVITTNCSTSELIEKVGQRVVSRLIEMTTPIRIMAGDYRMQRTRTSAM